jgi:hypothetical protein
MKETLRKFCTRIVERDASENASKKEKEKPCEGFLSPIQVSKQAPGHIQIPDSLFLIRTLQDNPETRVSHLSLTVCFGKQGDAYSVTFF